MSVNTKIPAQFEKMIEGLTATKKGNGTSRRDFLKGSGVLMVSFSMAGLAEANALSSKSANGSAAATQALGPYLNPGPDPRQLDSWVAILPDGTAMFYSGKTDNGQGLEIAFRQLMADELDLAFRQTRMIMGDTALTCDQNGMSASSALQRAGLPLRRACAEARRVLLDLAAAKFSVPVGDLTVSQGLVSVKADSSKKATYQELIAGRKFNTTLTWNGTYGNGLDVSGVAKVKTNQELQITGQSIPREDIPLIATGRFTFAMDVKVPGMLHARSVKPPVAGAKLISIDDSTVKSLPGFVQVVNAGNYVAVVAEREEQAIRAAELLKTEWEKPSKAAFPTSDDLYDYVKRTPPLSNPNPNQTGNVDAAFAAAAQVVEAEYHQCFTSHASFTPGCAVADPRNGQMTVWSGDQKAYAQRRGIAALLNMPLEQVRVIWVMGPGSYGRNDAGDIGLETAFIASKVGRPVRLQSMRHEGIAWDPKGAGGVMKIKGALDAQGNLTALDQESIWATANNQVDNAPNTPLETLIGQMMGLRYPSLRLGNAGNPPQNYDIPNKRSRVKQVPIGLDAESPIRAANLRAPQALQTAFASESFIDELAFAAKADPLEFRLRHRPATGTNARARGIAALKAAAEAFGWEPRIGHKPLGAGPIVTGRGIGARNGGRNGAVSVQIAEVEVNIETGYVRVKRWVIAYDTGLVVNPEGLRNVLQGQTLMAASRVMSEEVTFDTEKVTSVDWITYPIATHLDAPDRFDIVFVNGDLNPNRGDLPHYEGGEESTGDPGPAIANAIFDATGVRLRRVPMTPARVLAGLKALQG
ncbi:MAG: xanthine dehydrogenase family protein molybdopterin-binding subunit [Acidobacteria bacterium]|nr:xanthine dehydrogenase family protein molybdopterin-binding subunit [Acidobacteriota bacterium]